MQKVIEETMFITVIKFTSVLRKSFVAALGNGKTSWAISLLLQLASGIKPWIGSIAVWAWAIKPDLSPASRTGWSCSTVCATEKTTWETSPVRPCY